MILLTHIIVALLSLIVASVVLFFPTVTRIKISYGLIVATAASGTLLLVSNPASLLHVCLSGLFYVTVVSLVTIATHLRIKRGAHDTAALLTDK